MNIEKLVKYLKEFTLDEIEMIAECDCKTELEHLLNENKIIFEQGVYKFKEVASQEYDIFILKNSDIKHCTFNQAINYFMNNYAQKYCKTGTYKNYRTIFNYGILPYFKRKDINNIQIDDIKKFYLKLVSWNYKPRRIKNTLSLLNQLLKYLHEQSFIQKRCIFQVKRLTSKNEFSENRLNFKENL